MSRVLQTSIVLVAAVFAACSQNADEGGSVQTPPFVGTDGATLYAAACAECHGPDLRGTEQGPPFLHSVYEPGHHADASFLVAVRRGARSHHWDFGDMEPIPGLTDAQVNAIVQYVRAEQRAVGID